MPDTSPPSLRRTTGEHPATGPTPNADRPGAPPADSPEPTHRADDVYGFLSSFTAGVQRGLDETRERGAPRDDRQ